MEKIKFATTIYKSTAETINRIAVEKRWNLNTVIEVAVEKLANELEKSESITTVTDSK